MRSFHRFILYSTIPLAFSCNKTSKTQNLKASIDTTGSLEYWHSFQVEDTMAVFNFNLETPSSNLTLKDGQLIKAMGHFHSAQIRISESKNGISGYRVIRPFSYLRERISIGAPIWFAHDALLIDIGWLPETADTNCLQKLLESSLEQPITIYAVNSNFSISAPESINPQDLFMAGNYDVELLWNLVHYQLRNSTMPPPGATDLPVYLELVDTGLGDNNYVALHNAA